MKPETADVLLILEGTYPYVAGGVSSWVHSLVCDMPHLTFGILYLRSSFREHQQRKFELPPNVVYLLEISVHELGPGWAQGAGKDAGAFWKAVQDFHLQLQEGNLRDFAGLYRQLGDPRQRALSFQEMVQHPKMWDVLVETYERYASEVAWTDFFYAWRASHFPLLQLFATELPPAKVIHTICTGWAGLLGVLCHYRYKRPLILTEHGIYTNERRIEIGQAEWIQGIAQDESRFRAEPGYFKVLWTRLFEALGRTTYEHCSTIYTLYRGNRELQVQFGAPREKVRIIPNGVKLERFWNETEPLPETGPLVVGFVGRVVPIKDVKTLIRAARIVCDRAPRVEFWLLGPTDEDPDYFQECESLVKLLDLEKSLKFLGRQNVIQYYPKLHLQVLTSISEGQPLVILEGFCSGVPCVATNVGGCSEILEGLTSDDRALGPAGRLTSVCNPSATAEAILEILTDPKLHASMVAAARSRVKQFYDHKDMVASYRRIYENQCKAPDVEPLALQKA